MPGATLPFTYAEITPFSNSVCSFCTAAKTVDFSDIVGVVTRLDKALTETGKISDALKQKVTIFIGYFKFFAG